MLWNVVYTCCGMYSFSDRRLRWQLRGGSNADDDGVMQDVAAMGSDEASAGEEMTGGLAAGQEGATIPAGQEDATTGQEGATTQGVGPSTSGVKVPLVAAAGEEPMQVEEVEAAGEAAEVVDDGEDSAEATDRGEVRAPYYDGVRVKCLFVQEDT